MKTAAAAISFLLAVPLLFVSAAPLDQVELERRNGNSCTCNGRHYADVWSASSNPSYFSNFEKIPLANCPKPMYRWVLASHHLDRAVYSGNHFCGCITHEGATTRNGFVACH
ncbi:hypothetical protein BDN70DRAFT_926479 [Pholiota conissans]|uniref:Uncharacterized protein n=1 Tax=Pholiota conissans TaxID=109636 RepID=A0A9P5YKP5_9AGAR|nr:hypothetical protein BDN70DRAFT_926479 [Pholiota conissans]